MNLQEYEAIRADRPETQAPGGERGYVDQWGNFVPRPVTPNGNGHHREDDAPPPEPPPDVEEAEPFELTDCGCGDLPAHSPEDCGGTAEWARQEAAYARPIAADLGLPVADPVDAAIVDWSTFWSDDTGGDWLVEPILPAGRQVAMFASAKAGKSLLALEVAAALATGRAVLDQPAGPPQRVVYLDWEQSADDLRERLADFGYGPEVDLSNLVYYLLPNLPSLDTKAGGEVMAGIVARKRPVAVVIDTMARAVEGDEDKSDTLRAFYRFTGTRIKQAGVTLLRLDHAGKDPAKGQRGTSSKTEDVDVVFKLTAEGSRVELRRTHSRVPWVPERVVLTRRDEPHLEHRRQDVAGWLVGTADVANDLDDLGVPLDATLRTALAELKNADRSRRRAVVADALKYRRTRP